MRSQFNDHNLQPGGATALGCAHGEQLAPRGRSKLEPRTFEFERLAESRFDTADPAGKGARAWTVLLGRKTAP